MFDYELLTVAEVAVMLRCSASTAYNLVKQGKIAYLKRGKQFFLLKSSVMDYVHSKCSLKVR